MKKLFYISAALLALMVAGCNKAEIDTPDPVDNSSENTGTYQIKAEILNSKTTYDDTGKFSWLSTDKITVVVWNDGTTDATKLNAFDHYTFNNATGEGATATFEGSAINTPWHEYGVALYPNNNMSSYNLLKEGGAYDTGFQVVVNQEIRPNLDNPLEVVPLIGRKNSLGVYQFDTAMGILQVTLTNIPADAFYLYLQTPYPYDSYYLCGAFTIGSDNVIKSENYVSGSTDAYMKKTIAFTPQSAGETRTFYIPLPVGTIPAGTVLKLDKGSSGGYANIMTKEFKKAVTITAGHVTPLAAVSAETWNSLGTGKFMDDNGFYATGHYGRTASDFIDVTIEQHPTDLSRYRVVNPYQAYIDQKNKTAMDGALGPDPYLYFTIKDGYVDFDTYKCGFNYYNNGEFAITSPKAKNYANHWNNTILYGTQSNPLNIQLAPIYTKVADNSVLAATHENPKIEIVFPGGTPMMTEGANYANRGTISYSDGAVTASLGANVGAIQVVAAADLASGVAAIKAGGTDILTFTADGSQNLTGLTGGESYKLVYLVVNGDGTHGFTFKEGPTFVAPSIGQVTLTENMITVSVDAGNKDGSARYDGGGKAALVDSDISTFWHSPWMDVATLEYYQGYGYYSNITDPYYPTDLDGVYGAYIDIALNEALQDFHFSYYVRSNNNNGEPREIKIYGSHNGTDWTSTPLQTVADDALMKVAQGSLVELSTVNASEAYEYLRFAITKAGNGDTPSVLTDKTGSTALAEILLFKDAASSPVSGLPNYDPMTDSVSWDD